MPPVTTSTTDLKQLLLPRRLLDGRVELGSELTHRMLRNRALVEQRLTRQVLYEEFQAWLLAVEDWVTAHTSLELDELGSKSVHTVVRSTMDAALLRELEQRGVLAEGRISWDHLQDHPGGLEDYPT